MPDQSGAGPSGADPIGADPSGADPNEAGRTAAPAGVLDRIGALADLQVTPDGAAADLVVSAALHQPYGIVHGGVYAALAERVATAGAQAWLAERGRAHATVVGTQFLRAVRDGRVHATATPVHRGRGQQLWQVRMTESTGSGEPHVVATAEVRLVNEAT